MDDENAKVSANTEPSVPPASDPGGEEDPKVEIDLNRIFADEETDLNELFQDEEMRKLLKKINRNKNDLEKMKDRFVETFGEDQSEEEEQPEEEPSE